MPGSKPKPIKHGTYGGSQAHVKRGIPIDPDDSCGCRKAKRDYMQSLRDKTRGERKKLSETILVRERALIRLARSHPQEYRILLAKETKKRKIELMRARREKADR